MIIRNKVSQQPQLSNSRRCDDVIQMIRFYLFWCSMQPYHRHQHHHDTIQFLGPFRMKNGCQSAKMISNNFDFFSAHLSSSLLIRILSKMWEYQAINLFSDFLFCQTPIDPLFRNSFFFSSNLLFIVNWVVCNSSEKEIQSKFVLALISKFTPTHLSSCMVMDKLVWFGSKLTGTQILVKIGG